MKDAYFLLLKTPKAKAFSTEESYSAFTPAFSQAVIKTCYFISLPAVSDTGFHTGIHSPRHEGYNDQPAPGTSSIPGWFNGSAVLPLYKLELTGKTSKSKSYLNWEVIADEEVTGQELEVSLDGKHFCALISMTNTARSFIYKPVSACIVHYRLRVSFDNGNTYYSNTLLLSNDNNELRPSLAGKLISNNMIMIKSPGRYSWSVSDMNGEEVRKGELAMGTNMIYIPGIKSGLYTIRFAGQDNEWAEMLVSE